LNGPLVPNQQLVAGQPGIDDVKGVRPGCKQDGIVGQQAGNAILPSTPGEGLVDPVVVQFAPEELLEGFKPFGVRKKVQNGLLSLQFRLWQI
jgi:hypothetical protein